MIQIKISWYGKARERQRSEEASSDGPPIARELRYCVSVYPGSEKYAGKVGGLTR